MLQDMLGLVETDRDLTQVAFGLRDAAFHDTLPVSAGHQVVERCVMRRLPRPRSASTC